MYVLFLSLRHNLHVSCKIERTYVPLIGLHSIDANACAFRPKEMRLTYICMDPYALAIVTSTIIFGRDLGLNIENGIPLETSSPFEKLFQTDTCKHGQN